MYSITWLISVSTVLGLSAFLFYALLGEGKAQALFLPGETTAGHYQIELQCTACHGTTEDGTVGLVKQSSCLDCHGEELDRVGDSHPIAKFAKPTDALMLEPFDDAFNAKHVQADFCVTCHAEHDPEVTRPMGLSQPENYCMACHEDIAEERETHVGLGFDTCLTAGCHNFHDNSSLFEAFLTDHRNDENFKPESEALRPPRDFAQRDRAEREADGETIIALTAAMRDAPPSVDPDDELLHDWETTAHAKAGINCTACHEQEDDAGQIAWIDRPSYASCQTCHDTETHGFLKSRHGMRLDAGLSAMTPADARLPMKSAAAHTDMNCNACHGSHRFDTQHAAADACMSCHDDAHTNNYANSTHHDLWRDELAGVGTPGSGVSCATCHLPRVTQTVGTDSWVEVAHNQNDFLRPNEKMVRSVCIQCHGVPFTLDALADEALIEGNFHREPQGKHYDPSSFDLIAQKLDRLREEGRLNE